MVVLPKFPLKDRITQRCVREPIKHARAAERGRLNILNCHCNPRRGTKVEISKHLWGTESTKG